VLGSAGARSWRGDEQHALAAFPVASLDAVAAGDAFVGNLALALAEGRDDREALRRASAAGALATLVHGAQPSLPRRDELEAFLARHPL
jgi:ribokinase